MFNIISSRADTLYLRLCCLPSHLIHSAFALAEFAHVFQGDQISEVNGDRAGISEKGGTETGLQYRQVAYSHCKICNYPRHSDWTTKKHLKTRVTKCSTLAMFCSAKQQREFWIREHGPRYQPAQSTNEILIISLVCQWNEPERDPTGRAVRKKERESETGRMSRPWPLLSVERERDSDSEGGERSREKSSPRAPWLLVLRQSSAGTHHSDLLWSMTALLNSFPPIVRQKVLWLPHTAQISSAQETKCTVWKE